MGTLGQCKLGLGMLGEGMLDLCILGQDRIGKVSSCKFRLNMVRLWVARPGTVIPG
jgi:hypothetical protein